MTGEQSAIPNPDRDRDANCDPPSTAKESCIERHRFSLPPSVDHARFELRRDQSRSGRRNARRLPVHDLVCRIDHITKLIERRAKLVRWCVSCAMVHCMNRFPHLGVDRLEQACRAMYVLDRSDERRTCRGATFRLSEQLLDFTALEVDRVFHDTRLRMNA